MTITRQIRGWIAAGCVFALLGVMQYLLMPKTDHFGMFVDTQGLEKITSTDKYGASESLDNLRGYRIETENYGPFNTPSFRLMPHTDFWIETAHFKLYQSSLRRELFYYRLGNSYHEAGVDKRATVFLWPRDDTIELSFFTCL